MRPSCPSGMSPSPHPSSRQGRASDSLRDSDLARSRGDFDEALRLLDRAVEAMGEEPALLLARVTVLRESGDHSAALTAATHLLRRHPLMAEGHLAEGFIRLLIGDWRGGWTHREWRWNRPEYRRLAPTDIPVWDGTPNPDCRLRVVHEQGLGDFIQFLRYLPTTLDRVGSLVVETPAPLLRIAATSYPDIDFVPEGSKPRADVWVGMLSLPERLGAASDSIPDPAGYLSTTSASPRTPRNRQASPRGRLLRIGVAPSGNPKHPNDRLRTPSPEIFQPLAAIDGVDWCRIQPHDPGRPEISPSLQEPPWPLTDFSETARLMESLDLVLSVDTSVAHLAGALGLETWILLPFAPDWRWGASGDTTPWYRTARLYRQPRPADWHSVLDRVVLDLRRFRDENA